MSYFKKLTFLKVMTAVAWADGQMTHSELNLLKSFIREFNLDPEQLRELKPYLEAPLPKEAQEALFRQLIAELSSMEEKQEILQALETLAETNRKKDARELALVEQFAAWLKESSFTTRSLGKIRNFLQRTLFTAARDKDPDLERYFKRKIFKKIELKSAKLGHKINLPEDRIYDICLLGTLLASVAHVDGHFDEAEKKDLKKILAGRFGFHGAESDTLFEVVEEQERQGFDFHEVITQFNQRFSFNERLQLIDCFFAIATADGNISFEESEQIRKITKAMHIPHQYFKEAKIKALDSLK